MKKSPQPSVPVTEYFTLLPSEVCRLVLGYLRSNGYMESATALFSESESLAELRAQYLIIENLPLNLTQISMLDVIQDYLRMANEVARYLARINVTCRLGSISQFLPHILKLQPSSVLRFSHGRSNAHAYLPPRIIHLDKWTEQTRLPLLAVRPNALGVQSFTSPKAPTAVSCRNRLITCSASPTFGGCANALPAPRLIQAFQSPSPSTTHLTSNGESKIAGKPDVLGCSRAASLVPVSLVAAENRSEDERQTISVSSGPEALSSSKTDISTEASDSSVTIDGPPSSSYDGFLPIKDQDGPSSVHSTEPDDLPRVVDVCTRGAGVSFNVFSHLPPPHSPSVSTTSSVNNRGKVVQPPTQKRKKAQVPRRLSIKENENIPTTASEIDDVDFERFLSSLLSNAEQVASHINTKFSGLSATSHDDASTPTSQITQGTISSVPAKTVKSTVVSLMASHSTGSSSALSEGSDPHVCDIEAPPMLSCWSKQDCHQKINGFADSRDETNTLSDWTEDDLDNCVNCLLSGMEKKDGSVIEKESEQINEQVCPKPVEIVHLCDPSDLPPLPKSNSASSPKVQAFKEPSQQILDDPTNVHSTEPSESQVTKRSESDPPLVCSPPLCLSQFVKTASCSPHKRRKLNSAAWEDPNYFCTSSTLTTPDTKPTGSSHSAQVMHAMDGHVPDQDLFTTDQRMQVYEEFVRFDGLPPSHPLSSLVSGKNTSVSLGYHVQTLAAQMSYSCVPGSGAVTPSSTSVSSEWRSSSQSASNCIYSTVSSGELTSTSSCREPVSAPLHSYSSATATGQLPAVVQDPPNRPTSSSADKPVSQSPPRVTSCLKAASCVTHTPETNNISKSSLPRTGTPNVPVSASSAALRSMVPTPVLQPNTSENVTKAVIIQLPQGVVVDNYEEFVRFDGLPPSHPLSSLVSGKNTSVSLGYHVQTLAAQMSYSCVPGSGAVTPSSTSVSSEWRSSSQSASNCIYSTVSSGELTSTSSCREPVSAPLHSYSSATATGQLPAVVQDPPNRPTSSSADKPVSQSPPRVTSCLKAASCVTHTPETNNISKSSLPRTGTPNVPVSASSAALRSMVPTPVLQPNTSENVAKAVIIQLPQGVVVDNSLVQRHFVSGTRPVAIWFPHSLQGNAVSKRTFLPPDVDLDSPNPHSNPSTVFRVISQPNAPTTTYEVITCDKENRSPLIVEAGTNRKVLNLSSIDVDEILSKSH
ncbi:unnamed protein product [Calicophoron daubneyi]|uniref:LisH domain-containing protein n=1 Tax=Calicophoron daubneyi TaxID=300641 RepID=A0AAV2TGY0_CALDB